MDALPPNAGTAGMRRPRQRLGAAASNRTVDYLAATVIAALALAISPVAIRMLTGRAELTLRSVLLSVTFDVFLLLVAGAVLARGGARRFFFAAIACMLPFVLRRLGFDPATASAPFVATLVDVTGLCIYFTVALLILRGTLL